MICSSCGRDNPDDVAYCLDCGRRLEEEPGAATHAPAPVAPMGGVPAPAGQMPMPAPQVPAPAGQMPIPAPQVPAPAGQMPAPAPQMPAPAVPPPAPAPLAPAPAQPAPAPAPPLAAPVSSAQQPRVPISAPLPAASPEPVLPVSVASSGGSPCPRCGGQNPPTMNFCKHCGAPLKQEQAAATPALVDDGDDTQGSTRSCERCQGTLDQDAQFCKFCGMSLGPVEFSLPEPGIASDATRTGPLGGAPSTAANGARLVAILKDGSEGQTYPLTREATEIGRKEGNILLPEDPYLSPRHARLHLQDGRYFLKDLVSTNGVFLRLQEKCRLHHGEVVLIGQQILRFEVLEEAERGLGPAAQHGTLIFGTPESGCLARLCQLTTEGIVRDVYHVRRPEVVIGREGPDIVFPDDPFMSRRHARITHDGASRTFALEDLGSFNGTSLRFRGERELRSGDQFRVGNHLFLFEIGGVEL